ncbi:MAG: hypothetical protein DRO67_00625 [Candidatus Asgardarchaeum californiense]|nr:MAG: hypothetical protein DRO67_00625 [Candidatus Asgardarchaeum californiense]
MTDKKEQLNLKLGKVEYLTDPDFVPERYVDKVGIEELTPENFFELMEEFQETDNSFSYPMTGMLEGEHLLILESWDQEANLIAKLNGWTGEEVIKIFGTVKEYRERCNNDLKAGYSTEQNIKNRIKKLDTLAEYYAWIEFNEFDEVDLTDFGIESGFDDEYSLCACGNCNNIVRTSADSYQWMPPLDLGEGYISDECVSDGGYDEEILEYYANEAKSLPEERTPFNLGLIQVNTDTYQNGLHPGMDDSPEPILSKFAEANIDVWFQVYSNQFNIDFDVYVKSKDEDRATAILEGTNTYQGHSTAGNCEKALKSLDTSSVDAEGIQVSKVDTSTGTATTKIISKQDFIDGKALDD